jgi:hypothetical protein
MLGESNFLVWRGWSLIGLFVLSRDRIPAFLCFVVLLLTVGRWSKFNISGRRAGGSELIALDIDSPGDDGFFGMRAIKLVGYDGATGDGTFDSVGFDVEVVDSDTLRFFLINQRPPVDDNKNVLDTENLGVNSTVEVFEMVRGQNEMRHVRTVSSPAVFAANRPAALGGGAFVVTNDHGSKVGFVRCPIVYPFDILTVRS